MVKAVIFDMDGLLIDSEPFWSRAYKDAFRKLDIAITDSDMLGIRGMRPPEAIQHFYHKYGWEGRSQKDVEALINDDMLAMIKNEGKLLPGARQALEVCQKASLPMAIASSSNQELIDAVVDKLGIREFFKYIYSAENEQFGKPHPGVFITTAGLLGVAPRDCLVFEDAPAGVLAAKAAKMRCIAVPEAAIKHHPFIRTADVILGSLEEFDAEVLRQL